MKIFNYKKTENGLEFVSEEEIESNEPTPEEIIAEKEKQLLEMYEEIQRLKEQNS